MLRRGRPGLTAEESFALLGAITPAEWADVARAAWGVSPRAELVGMLAPDLAPGLGTDWAALVVEVIQEYGLTFAQVADLTVGQWQLLLSGGKLPESAAPFVARSRRAAQIVREVADG